MSDNAGASSSASSTKLNSSTSSNKKRTLSDAGLDDTSESDSQNNGKRVVVFEAFKLFDVQSAVSCSFKFLLGKKFSFHLGRTRCKTFTYSKQKVIRMCSKLS